MKALNVEEDVVDEEENLRVITVPEARKKTTQFQMK
tara:strand:+ start:847 stop:954 length:108 start_codon:yes stop_codon:yes gene_type:complete